ncbi:hypothetical protein [Rhodococcus spongiicola]|uniref:Uncharacterized protein n=1 Tax=Rhodococcus spongiicola TaxID=2487352 RepID=A0A3S3A8F8_9NOCA|nr:hypothetical protein [Rhodococcus spongiicola]RVW04462.1 hypothetical protein EF834_05095 [Rhodococcus spongiicola]
MPEPDESPPRLGTQRSDRDAAPVDFWSNERTELARLLVGHLALWTSVLIAFVLRAYSAGNLGWTGVYTQILVISVGLAFAVSVAARSRLRAGIGAALALSVPVVRALVMGVLGVFADEVGYYGYRAILITLAVTGVTAATAGWLVAQRSRRACLRALPLAAVLTLAMYLLIVFIESGAFGYTVFHIFNPIFSNWLGHTVFVIPAVITAWVAVAHDRRFSKADPAAAPSSPPNRA